MKEVRVKLNKRELKIDSIDAQMLSGCSMSDMHETAMYTYTFTSNQYFPIEAELEVHQVIEQPEKIKEFLKMNNISKGELMEWLNKNFKE